MQIVPWWMNYRESADSISMSGRDHFRPQEEGEEGVGDRVVIPSSPQVTLEKKPTTVKTSCCTKLIVFVGLSLLLGAITVTVVYVGFWMHIYDTENPGLLLLTGQLSDNELSNQTVIKSLTPESEACESVPNFPIAMKGGVITVFNKRVKVCGGIDGKRRYIQECYSLNEEWTFYLNMVMARAFASAVNVPEEGWWVTGGESEDGEILYSTDLLSIEGTEKFAPGPNLPQTLSRHCIVRMKGSKFMLVGGQSASRNFSSRAWLMTFDVKRPWIPKTDLNIPRHSHSCFWDGSQVFVVGGVTASGPTNSVESFDPSKYKWTLLQPLPFSVVGASLVIWDEIPSLITNGKVLKLKGETWEVSEFELEQKAEYGLAIITKIDWVCL